MFASWIVDQISRVCDLIVSAAALIPIITNLAWEKKLPIILLTLPLGLLIMFDPFGGGFPEWINYVGLTFSIIGLTLVIPFAWTVWSAVLAAASLTVLIPLSLALIIVSTPFGLDVAVFAAVLKFSAESTPPGEFVVKNLRAQTSKGLWHSLPYSDAEAFDSLVAWINKVRRRRKDVDGDVPKIPGAVT
jgi:hypothetical protein